MQVQLAISDAISHVSQFHFTLDAVPHVQTTTATNTKIFFCYLQIHREQVCKRASDDIDAINNNLAE